MKLYKITRTADILLDANSADYATNFLIIYVFFAMIVWTIQPPVSATTDFLRLHLSNAR
jgi:hypothetical protein